MKKSTMIIVICLICFSMGVLFMGYLSSQSSIVFIDMATTNYINEQEILAIKAKKNNNINKAIRHYENIVEAKEGLRGLEATKKSWAIFFPFKALTLETKSSLPSLAREIDIGDSYGKLANALEIAAQHKEAEEKYKKAITLTRLSHENLKKKIDILLKFEDDFLTLENDLLDN